QEDVFGSPFYVADPTVENYAELFAGPGARVRGFVVLPRVPFVRWLANSAVVLGASLVVTLVAGVLAAYALGRLQPPGWLWWRRPSRPRSAPSAPSATTSCSRRSSCSIRRGRRWRPGSA